MGLIIAHRTGIKLFCFLCGCEKLELYPSSCGETWVPVSAPGKPLSQVSYSLQSRNYPAAEMFALYHVVKGFVYVPSVLRTTSSLRAAGAHPSNFLFSGHRQTCTNPERNRCDGGEWGKQELNVSGIALLNVPQFPL